MYKIIILFNLVFFSLVSLANVPQKISLMDAILFAIRENPNVQSSQLNYLAQKFNLQVQQWQFSPHYSFQAVGIATHAKIAGNPYINSRRTNISPEVSLNTTIGTHLALSGANTSTDEHYNPALSLEIVQPLIRGFGKPVVEAALENARDTEKIAGLNIESTLRNTISEIINAYLDLASAQRAIVIDKDALERAEKSVQQTQLYIKAGHKAGNELVTVAANVASAKSQLENDKNNLAQTRYALLSAIGIDPNSDIDFEELDIHHLINQYYLPSLQQTKQLTLNNDIQYQIDQITLHGPTSRALLLAENDNKIQLDFSATAVTGNGSGGGKNAGVNSLINGLNQTNSIGFTLNVPIDDKLLKQGIENAKIALKQAELALLQEKWAKETGAINGWNLTNSTKRALKFAEDAEVLQEKTYHISYQKYIHGLIDSLEWQSAQFQLIQAQQNLLNAQIAYIKSLVNLDLLIGNTLKTWNIQVRLK